MSTNIKKLSHSKKEESRSALFSLAKNMKGEDAVAEFINHLLTESEQVTIGRRILIARMLLAGKNSAEIKSTLSVSPNTFSRTRKWLQRELPNYADALKDFENQQQQKKDVKRKTKREYIDPFSFTALRHKYPMHFLLFNIFLK